MAEYEDFELLFYNNGGVPSVRAEYRSGSDKAPLQLTELLGDIAGMYRRLAEHAESGRPEGGVRDLEPMRQQGDALDPDALGALLYTTLFTGKIAEKLATARDRPDGMLCLELKHDLSDPLLAGVAALPWELLRDPVADSRLALSPDITIVRHVDVSKSIHPRPFTSPLRILCAMSNPHGDLDLEAERTSVQEQLAAAQAEIEAHFEVVESLTELSSMLRRRDYHVLHYMGHGAFENGTGGLLLRDGVCQGTDLAPVLAHARELRLVVLNACRTAEIASTPGGNAFAGVASALLREGIQAVLAMQLPILDDAAALFAREFYTELARSRPIEEALSAARIALWSEFRNAAIAATPVLFQRGRVELAAPVYTAPLAVQQTTGRNLEDIQDDDLLFYMMDRADHGPSMGLAMREQEATGMPLVAVTHGNDEACFERLVDRLRKRELLQYLARDERPPIGDYPFRWPGGRHSAAELWPRIVQAIGHKNGITDVDRLSAHFRALPAPPLVYGSLPPDTWLECGLRRCLDDLLGGWAEWPRGPGCRRIIVIVNIRHARAETSTGLKRWFSRSKSSPNDGIDAALEGLSTSLDDRVHVITLPALGDISVDDATDWADHHVKAPGLVGEIKALFEKHERETGRATMSMDQASRCMSELIASMTTTRGAA